MDCANHEHMLGPFTQQRARDKHLKKLGYSSYREYLLSDLWRLTRHKAMRRAKYECELCGARADVVHHRGYAMGILLGDTHPLVALCRAHHEEIEFTADGNKRQLHRANQKLLKLAKAAGRKLAGGCRTPDCNFVAGKSGLCGYCRQNALEAAHAR